MKKGGPRKNCKKEKDQGKKKGKKKKEKNQGGFRGVAKLNGGTGGEKKKKGILEIPGIGKPGQPVQS